MVMLNLILTRSRLQDHLSSIIGLESLEWNGGMEDWNGILE